MPRIEPVPVECTDAASWSAFQQAVSDGKTTDTVLARILAHHPGIFEQHVKAVTNRTFDGLLGSRLNELIRLRSAQLGGCVICQSARYTTEVGEDDVACIAVGAAETLDERERRAVEFVRLMHVDHDAVDDTVYRSLRDVFTTAEVIELGMTTANLLGMHRWLHTLDLAGTAPPAIPLDPAAAER